MNERPSPAETREGLLPETKRSLDRNLLSVSNGSVADTRAVDLQRPLSGGKQAREGTKPTEGWRPATDIRAGQGG